MKQLVLVTGGAGFIGSHTVEMLLEQGYPVRIYDKLVEQVHDGSIPQHVSKEAQFIHGDMRDVDTLRCALKGVSMIVHGAAEVGVGQSMYEIVRYVDANSNGTAVLLELLATESHHVEKLVAASSMSIYGEGAYLCDYDGEVYPRLRPTGQLARREWEVRCPKCARSVKASPTSEEKPLLPTSIYAISKMSQELMCLAIGQAYDISAVALRYFNCYGPRQSVNNPYTGVAAIFSSRLLHRRPPIVFEDGRQGRDFIHVKDVARATILALASDRADGQALNIGTGRVRTILEVARILGQRLGVDIEPKIVGKARAGDIRHCYANVSKAHELLDFEPQTSFEDGLDNLVAWASEQKVVDQVDVAHTELAERNLTW